MAATSMHNQRLQYNQEESTEEEEEEVKQQQRMMIMKGLIKKVISEGRVDAESRWRVTELLSKPTAWIGGAQILVNEEDAKLLDRCEAKRKEWAKHW